MAVFPAATSVLAGAMTISAEGWGDREAKRERQRERERGKRYNYRWASGGVEE